MTKTFTTTASHRLTNTGQSAMMQLDLTTIDKLVWNFEFGSLGFIWVLIFGAWNFCDFH